MQNFLQIYYPYFYPPKLSLQTHLRVNNLQSRSDHLYEKDEIHRDHIDLQVVVHVIGVHLLARVQVELDVEGMGIALARLEPFHAIRLLDPALQDASHTFDRALAQFVRLASVVVDSPISLVQTPHGRGAVDTVAHTAHLLLGGQHWEETGHGALVQQQLPLHCMRSSIN